MGIYEELIERGLIAQVTSEEEASEVVKEKLEKKCKISLKNVCIAAAGRVLKTEKIRAEIEFDNEQIIEEDDIESEFNIISPENNKIFASGEIDFKFQVAGSDKGKFSSIKIFVNDEFIGQTSELVYSY